LKLLIGLAKNEDAINKYEFTSGIIEPGISVVEIGEKAYTIYYNKISWHENPDIYHNIGRLFDTYVNGLPPFSSFPDLSANEAEQYANAINEPNVIFVLKRSLLNGEYVSRNGNSSFFRSVNYTYDGEYRYGEGIYAYKINLLDT
jgi:hypothetical protein